MPKFLVIHPVGKELTMDAGAPVAKAIKANCTADAYWLKSTYVRGEGKLYCDWDAKDAESIQGVIDKAVPGFPSEIHQLEDEFIINAESFR